MSLKDLHVAGVDYRSVPVDLRERLTVSKGELRGALERVRAIPGVREAVLLSTCNRTECYWVASDPVDPLSLLQAACAAGEETVREIAPFVRVRSGEEAAGHLFRVACGLDSMVVGETQILHQAKRAYEGANGAGCTGPLLNSLFQKAFESARKVHATTRLAVQRASVPGVALDLASAIFDDLSEVFVLVVGTGEVARLTLEVLRKRGVRRAAFVSRTTEGAMAWEARSSSEVWTLSEIDKVLWKADIVIACTGADRPVLTPREIRTALGMRKGRQRPLLILDLGVPRNVDSSVASLEQVYLRDIDDLGQVVEQRKALQEAEIRAAEGVVREVLKGYLAKVTSRILREQSAALREDS
jgi:glutamyl-tRNA reductase